MHGLQAAFAGAQQNTELGTIYRYYGGLGVGNDLVHNNLHALSGVLGVMYTTEKAESDSIINSVEGVMQWKYKMYKFNNPDIEYFFRIQCISESHNTWQGSS